MTSDSFSCFVSDSFRRLASNCFSSSASGSVRCLSSFGLVCLSSLVLLQTVDLWLLQLFRFGFFQMFDIGLCQLFRFGLIQTGGHEFVQHVRIGFFACTFRCDHIFRVDCGTADRLLRVPDFSIELFQLIRLGDVQIVVDSGRSSLFSLVIF